MTAARLRTAAAALREEGGARNLALADMLREIARSADIVERPHYIEHALAVADAVLGDRAVVA